MDEEITADEFFRKLGPNPGKPFFGLTKPVLSANESALAKRLLSLFDKHKGKDTYHINYSLLVDDTWNIISPPVLAQLKSKQPVPVDDLQAAQKTASAAILSIYLQLVQPDNIPATEKVRTCHFFYQLLSTAKQLYGIDLIEGQTEFIHQLVQHKNHFERTPPFV